MTTDQISETKAIDSWPTEPVESERYHDADQFQYDCLRTCLDEPGHYIEPAFLRVVMRCISIQTEISELFEVIKKFVYHEHHNLSIVKVSQKLDKLADVLEIEQRELTEMMTYDIDPMLVWNVLGFIGEAGEFAGAAVCGKGDVAKEAGDSAWYLNTSLAKAGVPMSYSMATVTNKLLDRYPNGYNAEDSKIRKDIKE